MRCGDVESNPGPTLPPGSSQASKDTRLTRQTTLGVARNLLSSGKFGDSSHSPVSTPKPQPPTSQEPSISDIMATLDTIKAQGEQVQATLAEVKQDINELKENYVSLQTEVKGLRDEVADLREDNRHLHRTNDNLLKKLQDCDARIDDLEGRSKRNNLIFYGMHRRENETNADCEGILKDLFTDKLDLSGEYEFDRVHRLNARQDSPIIARCTSYKLKVDVLKAKRKLKGTPVFVGEGFSRGVREVRRRLAPHLKKARQDGCRAAMVFNYLLVDGKRFTVDGADRLVEVKSEAK